MKEIAITEIENLKIGCAQDPEAATGCTVILCERGAPAGVDVRGGGPASRESQLLQPTAAAEAPRRAPVGGSAFGLGAADGVMRYLAGAGVGVDTGVRPVPLVCESCLFDLGVGSPDAHPDAEMAYAACLDAEKNAPREGNFGAGTGATVGKLGGPARMMKSGQGFYAVRLGELKVGAVAAVNALGDVFDPDSGRKLAGLLAPDKSAFADSEEALFARLFEQTELLHRQHDARVRRHEREIWESADGEDRGDGPERLRARHPAGAHDRRRGQRLRPLGRGGRRGRQRGGHAGRARHGARRRPRRAGRRARLRASGRARLYALKAFIPAKPKRPWVGKGPAFRGAPGLFAGRRALLQAHFIFAAFILQEKKNADFVGLTIRREADKINLV